MTCRTLADALATHGSAVTEDQQSMLEHYCQQLWKWNARINLTRHLDYEAFVTRDLHDSRMLLKHLGLDETVLDVGAGGGVPGILLAILNPSLTVALSESTQKKAAAITSIVSELGLSVTVFAERAEDVLQTKSFNTLTARAVAPLRKLMQWFGPQRRHIGRMLLVKGPSWQTEVNDAEEAGLLSGVRLKVLSEYPTAGRDHRSVIVEARFTSQPRHGST